MSTCSKPDEIFSDNKIQTSDYNMSELREDDNILVEEIDSSTNNTVLEHAYESAKKFTNCNTVQNDFITSEKDEIINIPASTNVSLTEENHLINQSSTDSKDELGSENVLLSNCSSEVLNDASDSEKNSTENIDEILNNVPNSESNSTENTNEILNDTFNSGKNSNEIINSQSNSERNSTENSIEVSSNTTDSEKNSLTDNLEISNDVTNSEKNSLTDNIIECNEVSDSENNSNFESNVNNTKEITSPEYSSESQRNKSEEIKRDPAANYFEAKRLEYEEVLLQCRIKLESLGKDNISLRHLVTDLKMKLNEQEVEFKKKEANMKAELLAKIEKLSKECSTLHKEKESIVIRYANSEKEVIQSKKVQQDLEKKIKDLTKDRDSLLLKLKNASAENNKLTSSIENKMVEIAKLQRENEKINADCSSREIRIKWLQNKLKTEVTAHQETQGKLDQTLHRLNEMREEAEQVRRDCQEMIKCYQEAEEIKSVKLDSQLKQKLTELEVQKQEKCDQEQVYALLRHELDALKKKQRLTMDENNSLTLKINSLEKERLEYEQTICKLKDSQNLLKEEIADMTSRLTEMEGLKLQLEQEREKSAATLREVERLRLTNAELQSDLDACHVKEGDRLDFVEKLTAKTMLLQSDHCLLEVKAQALEDEVNQLKKTLTDVQQNYNELVAEFDSTKKDHESEMQLLVQKLAEKAKTVEKLNTRLEEAENENRVLKRRHIASIKELSRELYQCKKRLESYESNGSVRTESISLGSRASSSASLHISNTNEMCQTSPSVTCNSKKDNPPAQNGSSENQFTVDKEVLIERIINLQKMLAKKTDKIDFLEDHIEHLVKEMRKKSKSVDFKNV